MKSPAILTIIALATALLAVPAQGRITTLEIQSIEPFAAGMEFGATGSYVRLQGVARGVLDPTDSRNSVIVNIDKAPRNAQGLVEYEMDVFIMRPTELSQGNRKILYDVTNRGRKFLLHWLNDAPATTPAAINDPRNREDAGNGFVFREGYTIVWSGWDGSAPDQPDRMGIRLPVAADNGQSIDDNGTLNPIALSGNATGLTASLAVGISQSGRFLRHYLELGMNQGEQGRQVFDGMLPHISGAGKVFANHQFGHPFRTATRHQDYAFPENWFPFSYAAMEDPVSGRGGALLHNDGFDPLIIETNTSTEYWQKGASLLHTDPSGQRDVELPPTVRVYLLAGTQHGGRGGLNDQAGNCANPRNPQNPMAALRALLVALDQWVSDGIEPPPSQIPTLSAGTLVDLDQFGMPAIPTMVAPGRPLYR